MTFACLLGCGRAGGAPATEERGLSDAPNPGRARFGDGIVRAERKCEASGPALVTIQLFLEPTGCSSLEWEGAFLWLQLRHGPDDTVPRRFRFHEDPPAGPHHHGCYTGGASSPTGTRCIPFDGVLELERLDLGEGAAGQVDVQLPTGERVTGRFESRWCGGVFEVKECPRSGGIPR